MIWYTARAKISLVCKQILSDYLHEMGVMLPCRPFKSCAQVQFSCINRFENKLLRQGVRMRWTDFYDKIIINNKEKSEFT